MAVAHMSLTGARPGWALAALASAQLITSLDFNIVYVALPDIGVHLGFSPHSQQWVFSAYSILFGGVLLLGGRAADLYGRRRMFMVGLALYAVSSLLGGLAPTPAAMISARGLQGIGGALLFPATLALINTQFEEGPNRNRALGLWSLAGSTGLTLGSLVGGFLVGALGWPWIFFVNLPIAVAVGAAAVSSIPADGTTRDVKILDLPGALVSTAAVAILVLVLVEAPDLGWRSPYVWMGMILALLLFAVFAVVERRAVQPLVPFAMLRRGSLGLAMAMTFMFMATFMALPYFMTLLFQEAYGFTPLQTGVAFLIPCLAIAAGSQIGSQLAAKAGARFLLVMGLIVGASGAVLIALAIKSGQTYLALVPGLIMFGLGQGTTWPPMWIVAAADIPPEDQGLASGMASTTLWIGGAAGLAVLVAIAGMPADGATPHASVLVETSSRAIFAIAAGIVLSLPIALLSRDAAKGGAAHAL